MFQCPWTSAEGMHQITGEDEEMVTGDKEEDPPARGNISAPGYRSSSRCFNCGKEGHYAHNCPQKKFTPCNEKNNRQANLINLQDEEEQD